MERSRGQAMATARGLRNGLVAEIDERGMEGHWFDTPDARPFHGTVLFRGKTLTSLPRFTKHLGNHSRVEIALIESRFAPADHGGDDSGKCLHAADGADGV